MRIVLAALFPLVLAGCGLPPAITLISYALDGVSLFSTGKTVGDHALSMAMHQDCKVWRVVNDQSVCRDLLPGETNKLIAQAVEWQDGQEVVGQPKFANQVFDDAPVQTTSGDPVVVPDYLRGLVTGDDDIIQSGITSVITPAAFSMRIDGRIDDAFGDAVDTRRTKPVATDEQRNISLARMNSGWNPPEDSVETIAAAYRTTKIEPAADKTAENLKELTTLRVMVLGSFAKPANAARAALKWRETGAVVVPNQVGATRMYRVVTAPVGENAAATQLLRIRSMGFKDAWALRLCDGGDAKAGACAGLRTSASE